MADDHGQSSESNVAVSDEDRPADLPAAAVVEHFPPEKMDRIVQLFQQGRSGANWFFWIAALSVVNSLIIHFGGETHFVMGMGATLIVDAVANGVAAQAPEAATFAKLLAIGFDATVVLMVLGTGWSARRRYLSIYGIGMFLYFLDALIFLIGPDVMSLCFHGLALFYLGRGFAAYRQINALARDPARRSVVAV
jgi:hypothetical protein